MEVCTPSLEVPRNDSREGSSEAWTLCIAGPQEDKERRAFHSEELAKIQKVREDGWTVELRGKNNERRSRSGCRCKLKARVCYMSCKEFRNNVVWSIYFTHPRTEAREMKWPAQYQQMASFPARAQVSWLPGHVLLGNGFLMYPESEYYKPQNGFNP